MSRAAEQEVKSTAVGANLIEEEKMEIGGVKWEVYSYYAKSIGVLFTSGTFLLYAVYQGFSLGSNIWLSEWSTDPRAATDTSVQNMYLAVYGVLGIFQVSQYYFVCLFVFLFALMSIPVTKSLIMYMHFVLNRNIVY